MAIMIKLEGKWEEKYEDEHSIEIWKYDTKKNPNGPIEVNITYKNGYDKQWSKMQKQNKDDKRTARQMKKINNKNKK